MERDDWEELTAQVESHGPRAVKFYLGNPEDHEDDFLEMDITSVRFDGDQIRVVLE